MYEKKAVQILCQMGVYNHMYIEIKIKFTRARHVAQVMNEKNLATLRSLLSFKHHFNR